MKTIQKSRYCILPLVFLFLSALLTSFKLQGQVQFNDPVYISKSFGYINMHRIVDMDQDGDLDVVFSDNGNLYLLERIGEHYGMIVLLSNKPDIKSLDVGDIDSDGNPDISFSIFSSNSIYWLQNTGNREYTLHVLSNNENGPENLIIVDLDGDGNVDILSNDFYTKRIIWHKNNGYQSFNRQTVIDYSEMNFYFAVKDLNLDGNKDLILASNGTKQLEWYKNDGTENFESHPIIEDLYCIQHFCCSDYNNDGDVDIVAVSEFDELIVICENDGSQNFNLQPISDTLSQASFVTTYDLDQDNDQDILLSSYVGDKVSWFKNTGSQNFTYGEIIDSIGGAKNLSVLDFDNDGNLDICVSARHDKMIYKLLNDGNENFEKENIGIFFDRIWNINMVDFDGDLDPDILGSHSGKAVWMENIDVGLFINHILDVYAGEGIEPADMNMDGAMDFLAASSDQRGLSWFENTGSNSFIEHCIDTSNHIPVKIEKGYLNNDDQFDIVVCYRNNDLMLQYINNDADSFISDTLYIGKKNYRSDLYILDFDFDGDDDIITANNTNNRLLFLSNDGNASYKEDLIFHSSPRTFCVVDLDNDADMDIVEERNDYKIFWFENFYNFTFMERFISQDFEMIYDLSAPDLNNDGIADILFGDAYQNKIHYFLSDGNGSFEYFLLQDSIGHVYAVEPVDIDADNDFDVIATGTYHDCILLFENLTLTVGKNKEHTHSGGEFLIFPNPFEQYIEISKIKGKSICSIHSLDGKIISQHSCEGGNNRLFLSHIPPGVYILAIKTPGNNYATKIIKNSSNDY